MRTHTSVLEMQKLCRETMAYLTGCIRPGIALTEIRRMAEEYLLSHGADSFWYHGVGAMVYGGTDTALSQSGRDYVTADRILGENDILTIDLSPQHGGYWGDFARTLILQDGKLVTDAAEVQNEQWRTGLEAEKKLHDLLWAAATPETTFAELHRILTARIVSLGFENADFRGNLGHSIAARPEDRIFIEPGNDRRLSSVSAFTLEPHIRRPGSSYGFKWENIYRFDGRSVDVV